MKNSKNFFSLFAFLILFFSLINFISAGSLSVTQEHPFYVNGSWVTAKQLAVGDILQTADGGQVRIKSIEDILVPRGVQVYNLHVDGVNDFFAGGVLVHNKAERAGPENPFLEETAYTSATEVRVQWNAEKWTGNTLESIIPDGTIPEIGANIRRNWRITEMDKLTATSDRYYLERSVSDFVFKMNEDLPFLSFKNMQEYETHLFTRAAATGTLPDSVAKQAFQNYLNQFSTGPIKLTSLQKSQMLDCTGQSLTILKSLPEEQQAGWKIFRDVYTDPQGVKHLRPHTFLAKEYGDYVAIIDSSEIMGNGGAPHGFTDTLANFKTKGYQEVDISKFLPSKGPPDTPTP